MLRYVRSHPRRWEIRLGVLLALIGAVMLVGGAGWLLREQFAPVLVNPSIGAFDALDAGDAVAVSGTVAVDGARAAGSVIAYNLYPAQSPNTGTPVHQERAGFDLQVADGFIAVEDGYSIDLSSAPQRAEGQYVYYELRAGDPVTVRGSVRPGDDRAIAAQTVAIGAAATASIGWPPLALLGAGALFATVGALIIRRAASGR